MNQQTLFDLPEESAQPKPKRVPCWYIVVKHQDAWYFFDGGHDNGGDDFVIVDHLRSNGGTRTPHLYKTYAGAKAKAKGLDFQAVEVRQWKPRG